MHINKEIEQSINADRESDLYRSKHGFSKPQFEKHSGSGQLKRF